MRGGLLVSIRGGGIERTEKNVDDLPVVLATIEGRILRLVREGDRDIPVDNLVSELTLLSDDLRRCYRRLADLVERRDFGFGKQRRLRQLQAQCIWLYRKAQQEQAFFKKLALEATLRRLISDEAFAVYQQLLGVDDEERRLAGSDDAAVAGLLFAEPPEPPEPPLL
jgi:hypothetical protein